MIEVVYHNSRSAIGDNKFQQGIGKYINDYQYGTASLTNFLQTMDTTGKIKKLFVRK